MHKPQNINRRSINNKHENRYQNQRKNPSSKCLQILLLYFPYYQYCRIFCIFSVICYCCLAFSFTSYNSIFHILHSCCFVISIVDASICVVNVSILLSFPLLNTILLRSTSVWMCIMRAHTKKNPLNIGNMTMHEAFNIASESHIDFTVLARAPFFLVALCIHTSYRLYFHNSMALP